MLRILVTIPHFFRRDRAPQPERARHASLAADPRPRVVALSFCISALHQLFDRNCRVMNLETRKGEPAGQLTGADVQIVVCTSRSQHLLDQLPLAPGTFDHHPTNCPPELLGFECQAVLAERLGRFDYYCYLEDDLVLHDPWLFLKLQWFGGHLGHENLLQPNRYEVDVKGPVHKAYVDGDLAERATASFQNVHDAPKLQTNVLGREIRFLRARNPHSGCYFLSDEQMEHWKRQPYFLERSTAFIGPLESAATLGIMRTFKVYKPAPENADFLEVEHFGSQFLRQLRPAE